jgi:hypothetical protein
LPLCSVHQAGQSVDYRSSDDRLVRPARKRHTDLFSEDYNENLFSEEYARTFTSENCDENFLSEDYARPSPVRTTTRNSSAKRGPLCVHLQTTDYLE